MIAAAEFAAAGRALRLARSTPVAVAVSGGVDSMALCHLAVGYFDTVYALTVDHSLRGESAIEADLVGSLP
jgi:tRNA(Ile)-lysidine synthase TilS/MesJ